MKRIVAGCMMLAAVGAGAQEIRYDAAIGSELMRNALNQQAVGAIQGNAALQQDYLQMSLQQALAQEAGRRGLAERIDVQNALRDLRRQVLIQALKEEIVRAQPLPTDAELQEAYKKNRADLKLPEAFKLDIFRMAKTNTQAIAKAKVMTVTGKIEEDGLIQAGSQKVSDATAEIWHVKNSMPEDVWEKITGMKDGELYLYEGDQANLLIRRGEARAERPLTFDEAKGLLKNQLTQMKGEAAWNELIQQQQKALGVE